MVEDASDGAVRESLVERLGQLEIERLRSEHQVLIVEAKQNELKKAIAEMDAMDEADPSSPIATRAHLELQVYKWREVIKTQMEQLHNKASDMLTDTESQSLQSAFTTRYNDLSKYLQQHTEDISRKHNNEITQLKAAHDLERAKDKICLEATRLELQNLQSQFSKIQNDNKALRQRLHGFLTNTQIPFIVLEADERDNFNVDTNPSTKSLSKIAKLADFPVYTSPFDKYIQMDENGGGSNNKTKRRSAVYYEAVQSDSVDVAVGEYLETMGLCEMILAVPKDFKWISAPGRYRFNNEEIVCEIQGGKPMVRSGGVRLSFGDFIQQAADGGKKASLSYTSSTRRVSRGSRGSSRNNSRHSKNSFS